MKTTHYLLLLLTGVLAVLPVLSSARNKGPEPVLTERGQELKKIYSDQLDAISKKISAALPVIDGSKKEAFEAARTELAPSRLHARMMPNPYTRHTTWPNRLPKPKHLRAPDH